jgi:hypothetical protein
MAVTLDNCSVLQYYVDQSISAKFTAEDGQTATGYIKNYSFSRSRFDHVEIGESPDRLGDSLIWASGIKAIEPADLEKARASLLEKYSSEEAEKIIARMNVSF